MDSTAHRSWDDEVGAEHEHIRRRRATEIPLADNVVGLALSGGGIRSATFGLGVLEGLKALGLLRRIDYLSTVSGGGYIGAWLSANCKRAVERRALVKAELDAAQIKAARAAGEARPGDLTDAAKAATAEEAYQLEPDWLTPEAKWKRSIDHLRRYSNYLSPQIGFFSADTWSLFAIWVRNTLLVQVTVILAIALALLLPRPLFVLFQAWPASGDWRWATVAIFVLGVAGIAGNQLRQNKRGEFAFLRASGWRVGSAIAAALLVAAVAWGNGRHFDPFTDEKSVDWWAAAPISFLLVAAGFALLPVGVKLVGTFVRLISPDSLPPKEINYSQGWVQVAVVAPMMVTGFLLAAVFWGQTGHLTKLDRFGALFGNGWRYWPLPLSVAAASLWLLSFCSIRRPANLKGRIVAFFAPIPAIVVLHALFCVIVLFVHMWARVADEGRWHAFVWAPAMVLFAFSLTIVVLIGMLGRQSTEGVREWWSRLGAWLLIYGVAWMLVAVATVYGPQFATWILNDDAWKGFSAIGGWMATTLAGIMAGNSASTGGVPKGVKSEKTISEKLLNVVAIIGPYVFIAGLLIGIATCLHLILLSVSQQDWSGIKDLHLKHWEYMSLARWTLPAAWAVMGVTAVCLVLLAARVDINEFSLNAFYRSRLSRCYLGATRFLPGQRVPQMFTGFDESDDLRMAELGIGDENNPPAGPVHIVNCALNLGGSSDLALHTRHSASFSLSPYGAGSGYKSRDSKGAETPLGYKPIAIYGGREGQPTLGQAISVSGAAASPNRGYHTSPVVAFLLTVFNVRLGWWFPNPLKPKAHAPSPWFSLRYLVKELFGGADDKSNYLMISDGGHFENLAAYGLIARKCRVIIISDAECDPNLQFEGLGTLIRMCQVDFDTRITIDVNAIRYGSGSTWSGTRCAVGEINYGDGKKGVLIYLKASMTGLEDSAILQYKASHPFFPHETTADQFYGEDQFESYRLLGYEIAMRTFKPDGKKADFVEMAELLKEVWSPSLAHLGRFTQHSERLMDLWTQLGSNQKLQVLDQEDEKLLSAKWPDEKSPESFREVFYVCSQMIQLMENVYLDLGLEDTWDHLDNAGWRTMFEGWAKSAAMKKTWEMTSTNFGKRFQYFCNREFGFPIPK